MTVRDATEDDINDIVQMSSVFWNESVYKLETFDPESCEAMVQVSLDHKLCCVLEIDDKLEGFAGGLKAPMMAACEVLTGVELSWWVNPEFRKGSNGIRLLKHLEQQARDAGVKYWSMAYMYCSMPGHVKRLYEAMGYERTEVMYTKILQ